MVRSESSAPSALDSKSPTRTTISTALIRSRALDVDALALGSPGARRFPRREA